jgi:short subunit dehydrogenase-like uncharacterized protein
VRTSVADAWVSWLYGACMSTILLLGANGTMGRLIARKASQRGLSLVLAGRDLDQLVQLAENLAPAPVRAALADLGNPEACRSLMAGVDLVLNTVGPFSRYAGPVVDACVRAGVAYVDLANELPAVRGLLQRDAEARRRGVTLVTGAGFGVVATETLALLLAQRSGEQLVDVELATAPAVASTSGGVRATVAEALAGGCARYSDGQLVAVPFGLGERTVTFPDGPRRVVPVPVGDLIAAQRATAAPNAVVFGDIAAHAVPPPDAANLRSYAWAAATTANGQCLEARLTFGEGLQASASIAIEVASRVLANPTPGAWTPGQLFGPELAEACGAQVEAIQPCPA